MRDRQERQRESERKRNSTVLCMNRPPLPRCRSGFRGRGRSNRETETETDRETGRQTESSTDLGMNRIPPASVASV